MAMSIEYKGTTYLRLIMRRLPNDPVLRKDLKAEGDSLFRAVRESCMERGYCTVTSSRRKWLGMLQPEERTSWTSAMRRWKPARKRTPGHTNTRLPAWCAGRSLTA
jgi:hypothetical protein